MRSATLQIMPSAYFWFLISGLFLACCIPSSKVAGQVYLGLRTCKLAGHVYSKSSRPAVAKLNLPQTCIKNALTKWPLHRTVRFRTALIRRTLYFNSRLKAKALTLSRGNANVFPEVGARLGLVWQRVRNGPACLSNNQGAQLGQRKRAHDHYHKLV